MAFKNVKLNLDEIKEYEISGDQKIRPIGGTIDREKNIKLFNYGHTFENYREQKFILVWDECIINVLLSNKFVSKTVCEWNLCNISIPQNCTIRKEDVMGELRNAMKVYGVFGYKFWNGNFDNSEIKINF